MSTAVNPKSGDGLTGWSSAAEDPIQVIIPGASEDCSFPATGNAALAYGPFNAKVVRVAVDISQGATGLRYARASTSAAAVTAASNPGVLIPGSIVEYIGLYLGDYIAFVSNDANAGVANVTVAE
jgi:hypothetical protein